MNWGEILTIALSSSVVATVASALINRPKTKAESHRIDTETDMSYMERVERRLNHIYEKLELYEERDAIHASAISCAHRCHIPDEECPVLTFLNNHPVPHKFNSRNDE